MNVYSTWYDGVLGQLSIAAGQPEAARQRLDTALAFARKTGMCFHDAELLRLRAHTHTDPSACHADLDAALELSAASATSELLRLRAHTHTDPSACHADLDAALELSRRQGATLFELRAALDDFELPGQPARAALIDVVSRMPTTSAWAELARAQAGLAEHSPRL